MGWLTGSLVFATVMSMLLAFESTLAEEQGASRVRRDAGPVVDPDEDDLRADAVGDLSSDSFDVQKRPWGRNNVAAWGKRSARYLEVPPVDKRKWGQKNMALWGKRFYDDDDAEQWEDEQPLTKRRWGQKHMAIWGKRSVGDMLKFDADRLEAQKRKWGQKNMALWG